jgi:hypothetical protein
MTESNIDDDASALLRAKRSPSPPEKSPSNSVPLISAEDAGPWSLEFFDLVDGSFFVRPTKVEAST